MHARGNSEAQSVSADRQLDGPILFKILDCAPEWDYVTGGAKVIIALQDLRPHPPPTPISLCFGEREVSLEGNMRRERVV